ncbi:unnamed protein product [Timema podura]|uniref:Uncharacterized protein n=1 Tax=Timema podura TaxID=61482 RepID=A0ABN7NGE6_TIMPD|nr:unnamed protein product [Timema podura]
MLLISIARKHRDDNVVPKAPAEFVPLCLVCLGYTMRDIRYKWNEGPNSVGVSNEVSLPQFKVLGHRQRAMEISLTTAYNPNAPSFQEPFS